MTVKNRKGGSRVEGEVEVEVQESLRVCWSNREVPSSST